MRRVIPPRNIVVFVNYYDKNKAQRWGILAEEYKNHMVVTDMFEEKIKVDKENIIKIQKKKSHISILK